MIFLIVIIFYDGIFLELDFSRDLILKDFDRRQWKIKFFLFFYIFTLEKLVSLSFSASAIPVSNVNPQFSHNRSSRESL